MKIAMIIVRTLMGLLFLFGAVTFFLNMFLNLFPMPPMSGAVKAFNDGLAASGYFFPLLKVMELVCGLMFVAGRFVPLATIIIAPIIVNIFMFHMVVDRTMPGPPIAVFLVLANIFVAYYYRSSYAGVLAAK